MNPEEILKKRIAKKHSLEDAKLLEAVRSITSIRTSELTNASILLAKTTKAAAELLAKTTQASADRLDQSNQTTERWVKRLTIIGIWVGLMQIALAFFALTIGR